MNQTNSFRRKRRPEGVDDAMMVYANSDRLALDENEHFTNHPLIQTDVDWVKSILGSTETSTVMDLGCGAGRASIALAAIGWNVIAVDLSRPMLNRLKLEAEMVSAADHHGNSGGRILPVQANLARLDFMPHNSVDAAVCLFSTLGMIRRPADRFRFLSVLANSMQPEGRLLIHVHNWFVQSSGWQGRKWMLGDLPRRLIRSHDFGNRSATYRGIHQLQIHLFTWPEIKNMLTQAGFRIESARCLDPETARPLPNTVYNRYFKAGGWLIACKKEKKQ